ncbi:MAG: leucine-rich repeat domain-containing protein [Bacteroidales bacterium]|nr:leucine-rich repeat domain-containing protein [Bacteroidales bacterium]
MKAMNSKTQSIRKMRKHYFSIAMIATMALASCGTENEDVQVLPVDGDKTVETPATDNKEQITFKAVYSDGEGISKTAVENRNCLVFTEGDNITVFDGKESSVFYGDITSGTSATCNFTGTADPDAENYYAVYSLKVEKMTASSASVEIPSAQDAEAGTFDKKAHVMVASASGAKKEFKFKTANAFIRITAPRNLKSVVMTGNNGEAIAGNVTVSGYSDITVSDASATSITLSGTMEKGKEYYISYAPAKFTKGITLTLIEETGKQGAYTTKDFEAKPNQVNNIKAEKLDKAFYYTLPKGASLSDYLASFTGEVAEVIVTECENLYNEVGDALFYNPDKKVKLVLPGSITQIDEETFMGTSNLLSIEMPGVTNIGNRAFYRCTSLVLTSLPDIVDHIGNQAFQDCINLEQITIPSNVEFLGDDAFFGCPSLKSITILGNPSINDPDKNDYNFCPNGTVINISQASYDSYKNYWKDCNGNTYITVKVNGVPVDELP